MANCTKASLEKSLGQLSQEYVNKEEHEVFCHFISLFLMHYPLDTLQERRVSDVFWCCYSLWNNLCSPAPKAAEIKVYNPGQANDKWSCNKTLVVVRQKDMPFLVDSMRVVLNRAACIVNVAKSTVLYVKRKGRKVVDIVSGAEASPPEKGYSKEALIYAEINLHTDEAERQYLKSAMETVFAEVDSVVTDYRPML